MLNCGARSFWTVAPARSLIDVCIQNSSHHRTSPGHRFYYHQFSSGRFIFRNLSYRKFNIGPCQRPYSGKLSDGNITFMLFGNTPLFMDSEPWLLVSRQPLCLTMQNHGR